MHSSLLIGAIMTAGALASPAVKVVDVVDVVTVTVTSGQPLPTSSTPAAAANNGGGFLEGSSAPPPPKPAAPKPTTAPAPAPAPAPSTGSAPQGDDMTSVVNRWRVKYGLNELKWNHDLDSNVQEVGANGQGHNEIHQLISGIAMGQVITPGQANSVPSDAKYSPFEMAYLAWLCEVATDPQLQPSENDGVNPCDEVQSVLHMIYSDTGHHDILVDPSWTGFSCGYYPNPEANQETSIYQGLYTCDYSK